MTRVVRALPLAVLVAVVVAAATSRIRRAPSRPVVAPPGAHDTQAIGPRSPFDALLTGPSPPPSASVPPGAPRMIHGSARHMHRAASRGPRAANVGFRVDVGGPIVAQVTASPDERTLYAASLSGELVALSRSDGSKQWSVPLGDRVYSTPLVADDGTIYVGSDSKTMFAVSPAGRILWRLMVEGEADSGATFAKDGTIVFAAGANVFGARTSGALAWRFSAKGKVFTAPAITDDGLVVFGSQDHHAYALHEDGKLAWSVDLGADVDGAPAVSDDGAIYVGTDAGEIVRLDHEGHVVFRAGVGGFVRGVLSVARNGDVLAGTYGPVPRVVRVDPKGVVLGAFAIHGTGAREFGIHGGPLEDANGALYFGAQDDAVYALETDGVVRFRFHTDADVDAPLTLLGDGSLLVPSEDGTLTMLLP